MLRKDLSCCWLPSVVVACTAMMLSGGSQVVAHSGDIAVAYPVHSITLDGDLSDWPAGLPEYKVVHAEYGDPVEDAADFDAHFRLGYDLELNRLYVAVEVKDQSLVIDATENASWDNQDGCELYIDTSHRPTGSRIVQYVRHGDRDDPGRC
jgi:hypothetical protein